ncbi:hypothetical protein VPH1254_0061 [Vibrio phage 1254]
MCLLVDDWRLNADSVKCNKILQLVDGSVTGIMFVGNMDIVLDMS